ncbi:pro-neuregulin-4, membrane-bound isoform-like [Scyliorhinus torazame]|uniref:pro-neuregulin-4, membrane-bound isoform-like n=1 Tax=Scyliorhinus torazame TaxID=75743 RepID=UPI003B59AE3A
MDHSDTMMPAHGELCPSSYESYCLNGGTCYILRTSNAFCWCDDTFIGSRCEEFLLLSQKPDRSLNQSVALIVVALLLVFALLIGMYLCYRRRRQNRSNQRNSSPYHTVATREATNIRNIISVRFIIQDADCRPV